MSETRTPDSGPPAVDRRRQPERREGRDRREEIRFEPGKDNRRSGTDRRKRKGWDGADIR